MRSQDLTEVTKQIVCNTLDGQDVKITGSHLPVEILFNGEVALIYREATQHSYLGLVEVSTARILSWIRAKCVVHFKASILKTDGASRSKTGSMQVQIVIYGQHCDQDNIGNILSDNKLYLQHPQFHDTSVKYENPQYFVAPGEALEIPDDYESSNNSRVPMSKLVNDVLGVFEGAGITAEYSEVKASSSLSTQLKEWVIHAVALRI